MPPPKTIIENDSGPKMLNPDYEIWMDGAREVIKGLQMINKKSKNIRDFERQVQALIVEWQDKLFWTGDR